MYRTLTKVPCNGLFCLRGILQLKTGRGFQNMFHMQINWTLLEYNFQFISSTPRSLKTYWSVFLGYKKWEMSLVWKRSQYCWIKILTDFWQIRIIIIVNIFTNGVVNMASQKQNCPTKSNLTVKSMKH